MSDIKSVCVYCGSSSRVDDVYKESAKQLGKVLAGEGMSLVYGGGHVGLMGIVADSILSEGSEAVGVIPRHIEEREVMHEGLTALHVVETMHERKQMMVDLSDAFIILAGGLGTMDEFFEIMTWRQLGLHDKPIIIVNINDYWTPLLEMIDNIIKEGFASDSDRNVMVVVDDISEVAQALANAPRERLDPQTKWM